MTHKAEQILSSPGPSSTTPVLEVEDLRTQFKVEEGIVRAVDGVSFSLKGGSVLALVGESGCGKSVTAYSILRLVQPPGKIVGGKILLRPRNGEQVDLAALDAKSKALLNIRGNIVSMIFQEPMTALSPVHTVGDQICEALLLHREIPREQAMQEAARMLGKVGIPTPDKWLKRYPFEMSGGMRQRVVIAMALVCRPEILIADEPTTALDVTIQAQILRLIRDLQRETGTSVLLITHDLGVVAQVADDVAVMYLGRIVERGSVRALLKEPCHPYTIGLLHSLPSLWPGRERLPSIAGSVPSLAQIPAGCPFHPRCSYMRRGLCDNGEPPALEVHCGGREVACLRADEIAQRKAG